MIHSYVWKKSWNFGKWTRCKQSYHHRFQNNNSTFAMLSILFTFTVSLYSNGFFSTHPTTVHHSPSPNSTIRTIYNTGSIIALDQDARIQPNSITTSWRRWCSLTKILRFQRYIWLWGNCGKIPLKYKEWGRGIALRLFVSSLWGFFFF